MYNVPIFYRVKEENMDEYIDENIENIKFESLTPKILDENNPIYTKALDFAFENDSIKNIAITGVYGSGKSTIWNTYVKEKNLKNIITVSLGKYEDECGKSKYNNYGKVENISCSPEVDNEKENRIERQIINQIVSQIDSKKISKSKYKFKSDKGDLIEIIFIFLFLASIFILINWNEFKNFKLELSVFNVLNLVLFISLFFIILGLKKKNIFNISKINFKLVEAQLDDKISTDETVIDKDMKEIVYLLDNSGTEVVVFEDLDRYNSTSIYTKLRELNFLLNHYVMISGDKKPVRFIYMLKDSLFFSKNRTKFFDFILPIVPIVDSKTSENELIELFKAVENAPDRSVLADISLYVDDMRLLKNIVNEYIVYSKVIPLGQIDLDSNKLFALITLKNIFPNEFDLLQEDKGFIRTVFDKLESNKREVALNLKKELEKINENVKFINRRIENDKFEAMALIISADVRPYNSQYKTMPQFLKEWSQTPDNSVTIQYPSGSQSYTYNNFVDRYVLTDDKKKALIEKFPEDFSSEINKLNLDREKIKKQIKDIEIYSYKELISIMTAEQKDELFSIDGFDIVESHYFPLIRVLILDGLLDETYWYYKGNFNVDRSNILKRNDTIYVKGLKEGKELDIFLDVETPEQIINRLKLTDFSRDNILNKKVLKTCIEKNNVKCVIAIADSVDVNDKYEDLVKILDEFDLELVRTYSNILINDKSDRLVRTLEYCEDESVETFKNILISVVTNTTITLDDLVVFKEYIEQNENIISLITEGQFDVFIDNIRSAGIKFEDASKANCDKARLVAVEQIQAYKLNVRNLIFISEAILEKTINYGSLLNEIYKSLKLSSSKEYIEDNFSSIVSNYIDGNKSEKNYQ